ncbi:MAG: proton-translocating transhydrogenase family protein, partial [Bacteroidota bacterium]
MEFSVQEIPALIESVLPELYLLILAVFLGIEVIGRVPQVLHTPLMSGS